MILRVILSRYLKISKENMIKKDRMCVPVCVIPRTGLSPSPCLPAGLIFTRAD